MKLIVLDNDLLGAPTPECAQIKEFAAVIAKESNPVGIFAWIYHVEDHNSPYAAYEEELRIERVADDIFGDKTYKPSKTVEAARIKYRTLSETLSVKLLKGAMVAIQKLQDYFDKIQLDKTDEHGKPVWSAKDLIANVANLGKVVEGLQKLTEQVEKEQLIGTANRRNVKTNRFSE